jgi:radical SAM protein with 4Fe4S-binding SPASM domain
VKLTIGTHLGAAKRKEKCRVTGMHGISPPYLVSYAITRKCNLKCKHCYSDALDVAAPDELSTSEAKKLLDTVAAWGIQLLIIDGGEPLCRDDFFDIAKYASDKGMRTVVGSNGTLIDVETAERMKQVGVQCVQISIDGAKPETHDSLRGEEGSFDRAMQGVEACKQAGLPFQFGMVIRKQSLPEVPSMLELAVKSGANAAEFFDLVQVARVRKECSGEILSNTERKNVMEWLAEAQRDCAIVIRTPGCPMYPLILKQKNVQPKHFPAHLLRRIPYYDRGCAAAMPNGYITILPNGDVIPCMLLQVKLGNIREESIVKLWEESPILAKLRSRLLLEGECNRCRHRDVCAGCRGRAYEETGSILASDPGCWISGE